MSFFTVVASSDVPRQGRESIFQLVDQGAVERTRRHEECPKRTPTPSDIPPTAVYLVPGLCVGLSGVVKTVCRSSAVERGCVYTKALVDLPTEELYIQPDYFFGATHGRAMAKFGGPEKYLVKSHTNCRYRW